MAAPRSSRCCSPPWTASGAGPGSVVWVEGEPGIGKSSLVAEALAGTDPRWETGWGMADQLAERLPLRVMLDCLQVRPGSPDPRRARAAELLRSREESLLAGGEASAAGLEVLVTLVDELCAAAPTVLVLDDLQWADERRCWSGTSLPPRSASCRCCWSRRAGRCPAGRRCSRCARASCAAGAR